jgi:hypothetical protein
MQQIAWTHAGRKLHLHRLPVLRPSRLPCRQLDKELPIGKIAMYTATQALSWFQAGEQRRFSGVPPCRGTTGRDPG